MASKQKQTYGVVLVKGHRYFYKGVMFHHGVSAEVDLATRNHLVGTKHFRDIDYEPAVAVPIPARRKGSVTVHRSEPGMTSSEGGATAASGELADDTEGAVGV